MILNLALTALALAIFTEFANFIATVR